MANKETHSGMTTETIIRLCQNGEIEQDSMYFQIDAAFEAGTISYKEARRLEGAVDQGFAV